MPKRTLLTITSSIGWCNYESGATGNNLYTTMIYNAIKTNYGKIEYINKGLGGNTSADAVINLPWNSYFQVGLALIGLGSNDSANQSVSVANYITNVSTIIDNLRARNPEVIIILVTPQMQDTAERNPYIQSYRDACDTIGVNKNVAVAHIETAWTFAEVAANTSADKLHPNILGHQKIFNIVWAKVQEVAIDWLNSLKN